MSNVVLKADGTVKLPADVRRAAGFKPGDRFTWVPRGNTIVLVPVLTIAQLRGIAEGADTSSLREP
ncbi:hypothetical protein LBMAG42_26650 [Deltaproteobacteria bacterium]|nr:hypothetical protein LBMAG42_26650 [Deltaproteobacteria bacterium]